MSFTLVEGQASNIIAGLKVSHELNLFKKSYNDKQLLIYCNMQKRLNLKQVENIKDVSLLRKIIDLIEIQIRSLENLGYDTSTYETFFIPVIITSRFKSLN